MNLFLVKRKSILIFNIFLGEGLLPCREKKKQVTRIPEYVPETYISSSKVTPCDYNEAMHLKCISWGERQAYSQTRRHTRRHTNRYTCRQTHRHADTETDTHSETRSFLTLGVLICDIRCHVYQAFKVQNSQRF